MKRFLFFILVAGLSFTTAAAQSEQAVIPTEKSLLWKITGNGLDSASYLFGTIHLIEESDFILKPKLKKAFSEVSKVTFEINMEDMSNPLAALSLMNKIMMPGDSTLEDLVSPEEYREIEAFFKKGDLQLPMFMMKKIKPAFLSMMDPEALSGGEFEENTVSYELKIFELCKEQKKEVDGLETMEFQIGLFDQIPLQKQAEMLLHTVHEVGDTTSENILQKMVATYLEEDINGMQEMMDVDSPEMMGIGEDLLANRNENWIPIMGEMMKKQPTLFAVGAGHLGGEKGVIYLLRQAGYEVEPVF